MSKPNLVEKIVSQYDVSKVTARQIVDEVFDTLSQQLKKDKRFFVSGFGTFKVIQRKARKARNPRTGEPIKVPARKDIKFRPSDSLKKSM